MLDDSESDEHMGAQRAVYDAVRCSAAQRVLCHLNISFPLIECSWPQFALAAVAIIRDREIHLFSAVISYRNIVSANLSMREMKKSWIFMDQLIVLIWEGSLLPFP